MLFPIGCGHPGSKRARLVTTTEISVERRAVRWRDRAVSYFVFLDEQEVGSVRQGEAWRGPCETGEHRLSVRVNMYGSKGWLSSNTVQFDLEPGQLGRFQCGPGGRAWKTLFPEYTMTMGRREYISLEKLPNAESV
jgi:hypothetical protein